MTNKELVAEAVKRMRALKLSENCINDFEKNGKVWQSENGGFLYTIREDVQKIIDEVEENYGGKIYHMIYCRANIGGETMELYNFLYVSKHENEWKYDIQDIESGCTLSYVYNVTCPEYSEFGTIGIKEEIGGLIRTC